MKTIFRRTLSAIFLFGGIFLLADGMFLAVKTNVNAGTAMVLLAGAALALCGLFSRQILRATEGGWLRILKYIVLALLLFLIFMIAFLTYVGRGGAVSYKEDAVVVLGAAVNGTRVSRSLAHRLDAAAEYARKNPKAAIIVSGGKGPQEAVTEAYAMEQYLLDKGIAPERIIKEEKATSTFENFQFSKAILDSRFKNEYDCVYVTSGYHLYRAGKIAEQAGMKAEGLGAVTEWYYLPSAYMRESLAVMKFWILKR